MMTRRKTEAEKALAGTARADRVKAEPMPDVASARCPADLPEGAKTWWRQLAPTLAGLGLLTVADLPAFRDLVTCLARLAECEQNISDRGVMVYGRGGGWVKNPAISAANQYRQAAFKWAAKFGLTPADRGGLQVPTDASEDQSLAELLFEYVREGDNE